MQWLRVVGAIVGIILVLGITGCAPSESAPQSTTVATPVATPTWEELKAQSQTISYKELSERNEQYAGKHYYFRGRVVEIIERGKEAYDFRVDVQTDSPSSAIVYLADLIPYAGQPLLEDDQIEFVGIAVGVEYESVVGQTITIPKLKAVAVIDTSGDVRWFTSDREIFITAQAQVATPKQIATETAKQSSTAAPTIATLTPATPEPTAIPPTTSPAWPRVVGATIGVIIAGFVVLAGISSLLPNKKEEAKPASQPTTAPSPGATPKSGGAVPSPQDNPGLATDCAALLQARATLAGSATLNWSTDRPIADWDGVTVDGAPPRVTALDLSERQLTGTLSPDLGALTNLQQIDLSSNQLSGCIPRQFASLVNLQVLALSSNQLSGPIPPELSGLRELRRLRLGFNELTGLIPPSLGGLVYLRSVALDYNQLSGFIPPELGALSDLRWLSLDSNQLSGPIPPELGALANLEWLSLDSNQLSGPIPPELGSLANLEWLDLSLNQLSGPIPRQLSYLTRLRIVRLAGNNLTGCVPDALRDIANNDFAELGLPFCGDVDPGEYASGTTVPDGQETNGLVADCAALLQARDTLAGSATLNWHEERPIGDWDGVRISGSPPRVTALDLPRCQLSGAIPAQMGALSHLELLALHNNWLSGPIPLQIGALANLQALTLNNNQLSGPIPSELGNLTNLQMLRLDSNQLSGAIPAELVALTMLQGLGLSDNQLTGAIPPQLGYLARLRILRLAGNALTGCVPPGLRYVANNDFAELGLPFCGD